MCPALISHRLSVASKITDRCLCSDLSKHGRGVIVLLNTAHFSATGQSWNSNRFQPFLEAQYGRLRNENGALCTLTNGLTSKDGSIFSLDLSVAAAQAPIPRLVCSDAQTDEQN